MGRVTTPLSDSQIKRAKPKEKKYKLADGNGLYLYVLPNGRKVWKLRYRQAGKDREYTIGDYPVISLAEARKRAQELRQMVRDGADLQKMRDEQERSEEQEEPILFKDVADVFLRFKEREYSPSHFLRQMKRIEQYILPAIGEKRVEEITKADIVRLVQNVPRVKTRSAKNTDKIETARRIFTLVGQIYRFGLHNDLIKENVPERIDANEILPKVQGGRLKAVTKEKDVKRLFALLLEYPGDTTRLALEFLALSALRPGNIRNMRWEWVDWDERVVVFPAAAMKAKSEFRLPLTKRMMEILKEMRKITGAYEHVFSSPVAPSKQMSENTLNYAHKRLGIEDHNAHGWRSAFSTICYEKQREHGFGYEVIESQLAHKVGGSVKMAYLRSDFLEERRELLEWWERFLRS